MPGQPFYCMGTDFLEERDGWTNASTHMIAGRAAQLILG
jgi:hypothetical protein